MSRVIQLTPASPDFQTDRSVDHLARQLGSEFSITRYSIGLDGDFHHPVAAALALRRMLNTEEHILHAWGDGAFCAAALAGAGHIVFSPAADKPCRIGAGTRMILGNRPVQIVFPTESMLRAFLPHQRVSWRCRVIPPVLSVDRLADPRDVKLRSELGFDDSAYVTLVPGESTRGASHRLAAWAISILHVIDPHHRLLAWGKGPMADGLARFGNRLHQPRLVTLAERKLNRRVDFEDLVAVADAVLIPADGFIPTLPISVCMAAGLPIVANASPSTGELLDSTSAVIVPQATPKTLAQAILGISEDQPLAMRLGRTARENARNMGALQDFTQQWRDCYQQVAALGPHRTALA